MGCFSFKTADTDKSISIQYSASGTFPVAVLIPKEFGGGRIIEKSYEGYGVFGGHDVFELLLKWNQKYLTPENLEKPNVDDYGVDKRSRENYLTALHEYECLCELISDYKNGMSSQKLSKKYWSDWKRDLGIEVGDDEDRRARLKYPLKIVEDLSLSYEDVEGFSKDCPYQGCC